MKIAVEGCAHGELERIYDTIRLLEEQDNLKIDVLICCGDFQSSRNEVDLKCMAVPQKYRDMCTFYKYYSGEKVAPILTIFIGGNHEASNYLQELPYGGWVAPNIYYLGYAGVINVKGIRIGGISGIYKGNDYHKGRHEHPPYSDNSIRSVYHIRNFDIFRLKQISGDLDIFLSHDWPTNVTRFGNVNQLIRFKPHFMEDISSGKLGSPPCETLLKQLKPKYWFSAHLHCKFAALVPHDEVSSTRFLALDKCLPRRRFLQVVDIPDNGEEDLSLHYDLEWLAILHLTNHLMSVKSTMVYMPGPNSGERYKFTPTNEEKSLVLSKFDNDLRIPQNFVKTAPVYDPASNVKGKLTIPVINPQTVEFCDRLGVDDPLRLLLGNTMLQTFIEADDCNRTLNVTSFINDSDFSKDDDDIETSTPNKTRSRLSLPAPKSEDSSVVFDECLDDSKIGNISPIKLEVALETSELKSPLIAESSPLPSKRFKRRNAEMYSIDNE